MSAIVDLEQVRVRQGSQRSRLTTEAFDAPWVYGHLLRQDLDGDVAPEFVVAGLPHLTHATGPDGAQHLVAPESVTN